MSQALQDFVAQYKPLVDREIAVELKRREKEVAKISPELTPIMVAMKELSVGGKRLRALLVILGYQLTGKAVSEEIIKAAVVMELFHLGLLIQDDFMDQDVLRRGVKTINARFSNAHIGNSMAMLAGDYTFGWGMEMMTGLQLPAQQINQAIAVWGKYFTRVGYGQTLDGLEVADDKTILHILQIKSGEYSCILPLLLGATLGDAPAALLNKLERYGMELGWVFQLRDDWLGMFGDSKKMGKPAGEQAKKGKKTFATMYGRAKTEAAIAKHLAQGKALTMGNKVLDELIVWMAWRDN